MKKQYDPVSDCKMIHDFMGSPEGVDAFRYFYDEDLLDQVIEHIKTIKPVVGSYRITFTSRKFQDGRFRFVIYHGDIGIFIDHTSIASIAGKFRVIRDFVDKYPMYKKVVVSEQ